MAQRESDDAGSWSNRVPGTTAGQQSLPAHDEAALCVWLHPQAILAEQSAKCLPGVFRAATKHGAQVAHDVPNR